MARVMLNMAMHIGTRKLKGGSTIADSAGVALPGDFVWTGLTAQTYQRDMVALDASATTMKNASPFASVSPRPWITGVESID